ncbi:hypothetical protein FACS189481_5000 [Clostridia bacterium]|nr:hypothetical protein FACS189481_5000 [Clostridia bacterium]
MAKIKIKSNKAKHFKNKLLNAITVMFCIGVIVCCMVGVVLTIYVASIVKNKKDIDTTSLSCSTTICAIDKQGNPYEVCKLQSSENRIWINYEELPEYVGNAAIAVEDKRFMNHRGIDFLRTVAGTLNEIFPFFSGRQGGSTITQQLVREITGDREQTAMRKIREMVRALYLEKKLTKQEILEKYLNAVYFGNNTNGIEAAANLYFSKSAKELTLPEAAAIIGITRAPVNYDPFLHPERNKKRRGYVLRCMLDAGFIKQEQYDEAVSAELKIVDANNPKNKISKVNNYFVDHIIENVIDDLVKKHGYTKKYATKQVYNGGYRIYTTMDEKIQEILEKEFEDSSVFLKIKTGVKDLQAAMVIMDPNGAVKGIVGGIGKKKVNRGLNRATGIARQPGSAIKPISIYALAIESNMLNYSSQVLDKAVDKRDGRDWPHNAYERYYGTILLPRALEESSNAVAARVCADLGPRKCFDFMKQKLEISTLVEGRWEKNAKNAKSTKSTDIDVAPIGLGALTDGIRVLELTGAYQIFANGGNFTKPYFYTKVLNSKGEVILENNTQPKAVISKPTSLITRKLLRNVIESSNGTGKSARFKGFDIFGKTGTTSENKDVWFVGATPYYIGGVWVGYEQPKAMDYLWRDYPPTNLWRKVMEKVHNDLNLKLKKFEFEDDKCVVPYEYCTTSGLLASDKCLDRQMGIYDVKKPPPMCDGDHRTPEQKAAEEAALKAAEEAGLTGQPTVPASVPAEPAAEELAV